MNVLVCRTIQQTMYNITVMKRVLTIGVCLVLIVVFRMGEHGSNPPPQVASVSLSEHTRDINTYIATTSHDLSTVSVTPISFDTIPSSKMYRVTSVIDGDTLKVTQDELTVTVRMIGIDTPETVHPAKPVQCFGKEASEKAKVLLTDAMVRLEFHNSQGIRDKYGRLLAYVFLENGTNVNEYMIAEGYAYEYTYNVPYKYQSAFKEAEVSARVQKKGLWANGVCGDLQRTDSPATVQTKPVIYPHTMELNETYICTTNTYNCSDFSLQSDAQKVFDVCGGAMNDIHKLDSDKDGMVCEGLP